LFYSDVIRKLQITFHNVLYFNDFLCRATGDDTRSLCTTVCKWTYLGHAHMEQWKESDSRDMEACGWDNVFWEEIGLGDLVEGNSTKIGE
jgi:ribulose kinase